MKKDRQYDVFISYRRMDGTTGTGGESEANTIYYYLKGQGYRVFRDREELRSGKFNEQLYAVIDNCTDLLVVLSEGAFNRCVNEEDWLRLEVLHAIEKGKNIIPVFLRGFDIDAVKRQEGLPKSCTVSDIRFSPSQVVGYSIVGRGEVMTDGRTDNTNNVVRRIAIPVRYDAPFKGRVTFTVTGQWSSRIQSDNGIWRRVDDGRRAGWVKKEDLP